MAIIIIINIIVIVTVHHLVARSYRFVFYHITQLLSL